MGALLRYVQNFTKAYGVLHFSEKRKGCSIFVKNVSGIKQVGLRFPRHSYPAGKYLACIKICPARAILSRYKRFMTTSQCLSIHDPFGSIVSLLLRKQNDINCYAIA